MRTAYTEARCPTGVVRRFPTAPRADAERDWNYVREDMTREGATLQLEEAKPRGIGEGDILRRRLYEHPEYGWVELLLIDDGSW